jgi:serine kinase of HPr protein (carbohydrate metabolism regulator)
MIVHAGLVARPLGGRWQGALITGPSGSGKSDLALRLIDQGFSLVADDRTLLWTSGVGLFGRAPESLTGLIEARGIGVLFAPSHGFAPVTVAVECVEGPLERLPALETTAFLGRDVPLLRLVAREASAPAKLSRALMGLG